MNTATFIFMVIGVCATVHGLLRILDKLEGWQ